MPVEEWFIWSTAILVAAVAAVTDIRSRRIPNLLTLPTAAIALVIHYCSGVHHVALGWSSAWQFSLAGMLVGGGLMAVVCLASGGGGGDVKLALALGAILGPRLILLLLGITAVIALTGTVCLSVLRHGVRNGIRQVLTGPSQSKSQPDKGEQIDRRALVIMGPYFFLGTLILTYSYWRLAQLDG